ncbi:hypothetical protein B0J14DRAFT_702687 [Halenospora varia]|nr:hypothetical protein B0J14DRAFT_702687 [Halenospora varia]
MTMFIPRRSGSRKIVRTMITILELSIIILYGFILAGCTTKYLLLPSSHLITITHLNPSPTSAENLTFKVGYFGMCTSAPFQSQACAFTLGRSAQTLAQAFLSTLNFNLNSNTPVFVGESTMRMFELAAVLQSRVFLVFLIVPSSLYTIFLALTSLLTRSTSIPLPKSIFRRRLLNISTRATTYFPLILSVTCALGTRQVSSSLSLLGSISNSDIKVEMGNTLNIVQWLIVGLEVISAVASWIGDCEEEGNGEIFLPTEWEGMEKWVGVKCEV